MRTYKQIREECYQLEHEYKIYALLAIIFIWFYATIFLICYIILNKDVYLLSILIPLQFPVFIFLFSRFYKRKGDRIAEDVLDKKISFEEYYGLKSEEVELA